MTGIHLNLKALIRISGPAVLIILELQIRHANTYIAFITPFISQQKSAIQYQKGVFLLYKGQLPST